MQNLRPLYNAYMRYKHADAEAERQEAIEELRIKHDFDVVKAEELLKEDYSRYEE